MNKPKEKWWSVTKHDFGREFANPDYVRWADERIAALEYELAKFTSTNKQSVPCTCKRYGSFRQCTVCGGSIFYQTV